MANKDKFDIDISVKPAYLEEQSNPDAEHFVFAYTITIRNRGAAPAQLVSRHWIITDANGNTREVDGEGVVGEQPHLGPGERFEYTSGAVLETPVGSMYGHYDMLAEDGGTFQVDIPVFTLAVPRVLH